MTIYPTPFIFRRQGNGSPKLLQGRFRCEGARLQGDRPNRVESGVLSPLEQQR